VEFYLQGEDEFKAEYRTELKEAIISAAGSTEWDFNSRTRLIAMEKKA